MAHILLVDDDRDLREALMVALEQAGHEVTAYGNAERAIEKLPELQYDMVVTDLMLPGIDGAEFCRLLRRDHGGDALPILMLSNMPSEMGIKVSPEDRTWAPTDRFVDKKASMEEILQAIGELAARVN